MLEEGAWIPYTMSNVSKVIKNYSTENGQFEIDTSSLSAADQAALAPETTFAMRSGYISTYSRQEANSIEDYYSIVVRYDCSDAILIKL